MKNYEKYADEIREYKGTRFCDEFVKPHIFEADNCNGVDCQRCVTLQMLWLLEDYEEPKTDWSKVKVDTPMLVRDYESEEWVARHFAKYKGGKVYAWDNGYTSWTACDSYKGKAWKYAKLAESEVE